MQDWILENPWRAVVLVGGVLGMVLSVVGAAVRAGWPDSPWGRALAAASAALPLNIPGMMKAGDKPALPEVKP